MALDMKILLRQFSRRDENPSANLYAQRYTFKSAGMRFLVAFEVVD